MVSKPRQPSKPCRFPSRRHFDWWGLRGAHEKLFSFGINEPRRHPNSSLWESQLVFGRFHVQPSVRNLGPQLKTISGQSTLDRWIPVPKDVHDRVQALKIQKP